VSLSNHLLWDAISTEAMTYACPSTELRTNGLAVWLLRLRPSVTPSGDSGLISLVKWGRTAKRDSSSAFGAPRITVVGQALPKLGHDLFGE